MKAGEIYWVNLDPTIGDEIKKRRPVVVLNGGHDKHLKLAIVVPVTTWTSYWEKNPFFTSLEPNTKSGLNPSSSKMEQAYQISSKYAVCDYVTA